MNQQSTWMWTAFKYSLIRCGCERKKPCLHRGMRHRSLWIDETMPAYAGDCFGNHDLWHSFRTASIWGWATLAKSNQEDSNNGPVCRTCFFLSFSGQKQWNLWILNANRFIFHFLFSIWCFVDAYVIFLSHEKDRWHCAIIPFEAKRDGLHRVEIAMTQLLMPKTLC